MSTHSSRSQGVHRRLNSHQTERRGSRDVSRMRRRTISQNEAYSYALRAAYLSYLLQPRARRTEHVPAAPSRSSTRSSMSINDLMKDFTLLRDTKSTRFPHGFIYELEKRLRGLITGTEKRQEYRDAQVKGTFAAFYNALIEPSFKKRMEKDRRVEDLILIFVSNATKQLQLGKPAGDDGWKLMLDRHIALFVRLISLILKDNGWSRDKPELASRLTTLESKLLVHDQDLAETTQKGTTVEVVIPLSYDVKDMPLVQHVGRIFDVPHLQIQADIDKNKHIWTEKAALQDLKTYQTHLNLNTRRTLQLEDFETEEAYEAWKKSEAPDLSQMMLAIMQSSPDLTKTMGSMPQYNPAANGGTPISSPIEATRKPSLTSANISSYVIDQPLDVSGLNLGDEASDQLGETENIFTFMPVDTRSFYRSVVAQALMHDLRDESLRPSEATADMQAVKLFSKQTAELLNEIAVRWRIPPASRVVLFLDVIREKFVDREIELRTLDDAFTFVKEPPPVPNKRSSVLNLETIAQTVFDDRSKWTSADVVLMQRLLSALSEALLRELYEVMMRCYDVHSGQLGPVMFVMDHHVRGDPSFVGGNEELDMFRESVEVGLTEKAKEIYQSFLDKQIPENSESWEFYHVIELGKEIRKTAQRVQKRYKKNPEIMGVNLMMVLLDAMLPMYADDARDMVTRILEQAKATGQEVNIEDGFELYKEMVESRRLHLDSLPDIPFAFDIEELLADFVWRWIRMTDEKVVGWVDEAIKHDNFAVRTAVPNAVPTEDERHSSSVIDVFRSFNQVVSQIVALEWDNDLQYAKFMTAIARSIGIGMAKYCDTLEQTFSREMDRMTPEQEAALTQTRQEKWMQMAKDAWNNKERIEPFQFFPESLVKLNNIEFALQELNKLEHEINVDACADVIQRYTPPPTHRPRNTTYVFSLKVVEAEDLKACDVNGLSDPYVVLADEYQRRIGKTRVIYRNLNPRWDDTADITTQGPLNIIATIWDWDTLGDHDYVGRTSIKLDPAHFSDFLPREYWLDLDTQGRLLIRVSMEGERDDIQFYFGKAFRTLKRTERDMTRKITDKLSAYINHCLSRRALKSLLSRGLSVSSVSNYFNRNRPQSMAVGTTQVDVENALGPLFTYFDDNFAIMNQTLTREAMIMVMTRVWKEVLVTIESLLVPPLSDKPSMQRPLTQQEMDVVFKWLELLLNFFNAPDEETGEANGVSMGVLKSPKYHEIQTLNFFYFESTENLVRTSERMASATAARQQASRSRVSAPPNLGFGGAAGLMAMQSTRRAKSIMLSRNLGTMKKAKEEKWREAQAEPNDDMILRILRMRPEATGYLRDRSRQKERLAAAAAADLIVKQSLMASGNGRMTGRLGR